MNRSEKQDLVNYLSTFLTENKWTLMNEVLEKRTNALTIVLENIFQSQNASAAIRSCDGFGIQEVHIIENSNSYKLNPNVTMGSAKWLDIKQYNEYSENTTIALTELKRNGYEIVATTPDPLAPSIFDFEVKGKVALLFGTELTGLSEEAFALADQKVRIPMMGFTESFNISVCTALCLSIMREKIEKSGIEYLMDEEEKLDIKLEWIKRTLKRYDQLLIAYNSQKKK